MATKRKEYLCLISTDVNLDENEIVRIHEKHWDIEVFLKVCKSHLNLSREFNDNRSLGELFYTFQMKCPISHGYRLFKCCFKCSGQCFQTTPNFQIKKSTNWWTHLWIHFRSFWKQNCKLHKAWTLTTE